MTYECNVIKEEPFKGLKVDNVEALNKIQERASCSKCGASRMYFCYTCRQPLDYLKPFLPTLKLPLKIDIIKHKNEIDGKSTAIHAAILAPHDVRIYTYPDIPDYSNEDKVYLVYPSSKSISIDKLFHESNEKSDLLINEETDGKKCPQKTLRTERFHEEIERINHHFSSYEDLPIKKAVFIDSTWSQSKGIYKDERLKCLPTLVIQNRVSQFWRYQRGSPRWYLATVEAVHQFLLEVHMNAWGVHPDYKGPNAEKYLIVEKCETSPEIKPYCGQYDNILIFFCHMYNKIHSLYDHEQLKAYKRLMS